MLVYIAITVAFLSAFWLTEIVLRHAPDIPQRFTIAMYGYPSAIYVLISYFLGMEAKIPQEMLGYALLFMSIGVLGVNSGRVIATPELMEELKRARTMFSRIVLIYTLFETAAIFMLLAFILGENSFMYNDWKSLLISPNYFVPGIEILSILVFIGAIIMGFVVNRVMKSFHEKGLNLGGRGFQKILIYTSFPQWFWVIGLLLMILIYMGQISW